MRGGNVNEILFQNSDGTRQGFIATQYWTGNPALMQFGLRNTAGTANRWLIRLTGGDSGTVELRGPTTVYGQLNVNTISPWTDNTLEIREPTGPMMRITPTETTVDDLTFYDYGLLAGLGTNWGGYVSRIVGTVMLIAVEIGLIGWLIGLIIAAISSIRYKKNIQSIDQPLEKVLKLRGVEFDWKESGAHDIGMIAEEVGEVFPDLLTYEKDGKTIQGFRYDGLIGVLVEAIKEQQKQITELKEKVSALEKR